MEPVELQDDLFWLRDDTRKDEEILGLLRDENEYTQARTSHLARLRDDLYEEMLGHIQEDDDTHPSPSDDGYEYWSRTIKGASFKQYLRRPRSGRSGAEELILDVNAVAETLPEAQRAQCAVSEVEPSPSGGLLAYTLDGSGYETYDILFKDLGSGSELTERLSATGGGISWADDSTLFYVRQDDAHRPFQVWRHTLGTSQADDALVYEDKDELFNVHCWRSRDGSLLFIESESKETTEVHMVPTSKPTAPPTVVRPRQYGVRYDIDSHAPSRSLFVTSNADGNVNRELAISSIDTPGEWRKVLWTGGASSAAGDEQCAVLEHSETRSLDGLLVFSTFLAVCGREDGFTQVWVVPLAADGTTVDGTTAADGRGDASGDAVRLSFEDDAFEASVWGADNCLFDPAGQLRISYTSMIVPRALRQYDVLAGSSSSSAAGSSSSSSSSSLPYTTLRVQPVPNYDASSYRTKRMEVTARDGAQIPVTLLWRDGVACVNGDSPSPLHLYGYGSYGVCIDPSFASSRLALVDRGVVFAIAHVRGGGEMGHYAWYEAAGKYLHKKNTFHDFVDVASALLEAGIAAKGKLTCEGRSAGGLLVGNVVNLAPELFAAAVAGVPFVDLMTTMCDPSIPLTTEEWEEWGNPNEATYFDYMMGYSPINNVKEGATYPPMLIVSGLNDPRVAYWEPTKWAQVLRANVANGEEMLLKMDLAAGHFSASDRYRYLRELSFDYAWLLDRVGLATDGSATAAFKAEAEAKGGALDTAVTGALSTTTTTEPEVIMSTSDIKPGFRPGGYPSEY